MMQYFPASQIPVFHARMNMPSICVVDYGVLPTNGRVRTCYCSTHLATHPFPQPLAIGSQWDDDDVLVHEAQANLQAIWIPELQTLFKVRVHPQLPSSYRPTFKFDAIPCSVFVLFVGRPQVLRWENKHFHGERASVDELIHRVVVAHKYISSRLPRRAQLGLYAKLAKFNKQQLEAHNRYEAMQHTHKPAAVAGGDTAQPDPHTATKKAQKRWKKKRGRRRKAKSSTKPVPVLVGLSSALDTSR